MVIPRWALAGIVVASCLCGEAYGVVTTYHIGNSLTWDGQPVKVQEMSASQGIDHSEGHHIRTGSSLPTIFNDTPCSGTCIIGDEYGEFDVALPNNHFDVVFMQPHHNSTLGDDQTIIGQMINMSLGADRYVIYGTWPHTNAGADYQAAWDAPITNTPSQALSSTTRRRAYFTTLTDNVRDAFPNKEIHLLPLGDILYRLDQIIKADAFPDPSYTDAFDFYDDEQHLTNTGRWIAANALYTMIHRESPVGVPRPTSPNSFDIPTRGDPLPVGLEVYLQQVVWDVLYPHPYTGLYLPGDADLDGDVDLDDFDILAANFNTVVAGGPSEGDFNNDGVVNMDDYVTQALNFNAPGPGEGIPVLPEPTTVLVVINAASVCLLRRPRRDVSHP